MVQTRSNSSLSLKKRKHASWKSSKLTDFLTNPSKLITFCNDLCFDSKYLVLVCSILLPIEIILNLTIIFKIPYTEIDWKAYMQEVEGFLNGTLNYYELRGDTGPLVYPAGFVYVYSFLYYISNHGSNLQLAQFVFVFIYLVFIGFVFLIYNQTRKVPPIAMAIMCLTSHRIHSIFVLRLFNDPIAMLFLYASVFFLIKGCWKSGCVSFSLAVSIKMNVLLFAPGLFFILLVSHGLAQTFKYITLCAFVQLILGAPFLFTYPVAYIHRSFDLGRQFFFIWTVNWKFLPEHIFLSRYFHLALLALHLSCLLLFINKIFKKVGGLKKVLFQNRKPIRLNSDSMLLIMFVSNYIGICFSRSLHYQFYVWYYHTFAYLLWSTKLPNVIRFLIFGLVELCWNIYPSNAYSSGILNVCHLSVLAALWRDLDHQIQFKSNKD